MKLQMYSVRDAKASVFHPPYFNRSHGEAERNFDQLVNDPKSVQCQYPEDWDLYHLGEYDDESGQMSTLPSPKHLIKAVDVKRQIN